jgi:hypothetical protein
MKHEYISGTIHLTLNGSIQNRFQYMMFDNVNIQISKSYQMHDMITYIMDRRVRCPERIGTKSITLLSPEGLERLS